MLAKTVAKDQLLKSMLDFPSRKPIPLRNHLADGAGGTPKRRCQW